MTQIFRVALLVSLTGIVSYWIGLKLLVYTDLEAARLIVGVGGRGRGRGLEPLLL
jgi:hypothetical protein